MITRKIAAVSEWSTTSQAWAAPSSRPASAAARIWSGASTTGFRAGALPAPRRRAARGTDTEIAKILEPLDGALTGVEELAARRRAAPAR